MIVTGTGTGVGKTVATAAVAALALAAGERVTVVKPAQTGIAPGEPGDLADVVRLAGPAAASVPSAQSAPHGGPALRVLELARFPEPLAPATAARRAGTAPLTAAQVVDAVRELDGHADLVLVEGAGGLLVRLDDRGDTLADVAVGLGRAGVPAPVLLVASAGLGVLNSAALTAEALAARGLELAGTVVGAYPAEPDLAERTNLDDLPAVTGAPLLGVLPAGLGEADPEAFAEAARCGLGPVLGGGWSPGAGS